MIGSDARFSPLLSTLGIVALVGAAAPMACREDGGPPPIEEVADVVDVYEDLYAFYCECYGELYYGDGGAEECLSQTDIVGDDEVACLQEVFDANPEAFEAVRCQAEALRSLVACRRAEGCPSTFTCDDGTVILGDAVCDGYPSCEDGSDEQQDCPPPPTCADGESLAPYSICDGFGDCLDGSDEQDCPPPFECSDGSEIPPAWVCDAYPDCEDGSDEQQGCPVTCESRYSMQEDACGEVSEEVQELTASCNAYECLDGTQIPRAQVCDGEEDCPEGDDEHACPSPPPGGG
jgi:hypothetical protein